MAKYGKFTSIDNPAKFSQTYEAIIKVIGFLLTLALSYKGVDSAVANQVVTNTLSAFTLLGGAVLASWEAKNAIFGAVRKLIAALNKETL